MILIIDKILKDYYGFSSYNKIVRKDKIIIEYDKKIYFLYQIESLEKINHCFHLYTLVDYCNDFVRNRFGSIVTTINNEQYVLCSMNRKKEWKIPLFSFYSAQVQGKLKWRKLWIQKSDYLESYLTNNREKYPLIEESMPYYLGLLETGIYLLNEEESNRNLYIQHYVMKPNEYENPLNLMIDVKERDFSEYLKYLFISKKYKEKDLCYLIQQGKNFLDYSLVIARLFLANYYFHEVDEIIINSKDEKDLKEILKRTTEYEEYILSIIDEIKKIRPIKKYPILR